MYKIQEIQNVGIDISVSVSMSVNWNITEQINHIKHQFIIIQWISNEPQPKVGL